MSDINQWNVNMDMINIAYNLAQWLIVAVAAICGISLSVSTVGKAVRWAVNALYPLMDEPAEQQAIGAALKISPDTIDELSHLLEAIKAALNEPPQEVNRGYRQMTARPYRRNYRSWVAWRCMRRGGRR